MGTIAKSAAATVLTAVTIVFLGAGANSASASGAIYTSADNHSSIVCPDSMVWDGVKCVQL